MIPSLILVLGLELSAYPFSALTLYSPVPHSPTPRLYSETFSVSLILEETFFLGGSMEISEFPSQGRGFDLEKGVFGLMVGARWEGLEIGYEHWCFHPLITDIPRRERSPLYEGAIERFYIKTQVRTRIGGF